MFFENKKLGTKIWKFIKKFSPTKVVDLESFSFCGKIFGFYH